MNTQLKFDHNGNDVTITIQFTTEEYARALKAVPIPDSLVQGLEHSQEDFLPRLTKMVSFLENDK